jgi:hypothetical protein
MAELLNILIAEDNIVNPIHLKTLRFVQLIRWSDRTPVNMFFVDLLHSIYLKPFDVDYLLENIWETDVQ